MPQLLETYSDESLVAEAKAGSSACFEELVRRYQVRLARFVMRSVNREDADDVVQDAFVQAYLNLSRFDPKYRFKTWLFVIAQRLTIDRHRRRRVTANIENHSLASNDRPEHRAETDERSAMLWSVARRELGDEVYRAVWLHYVEDLSTTEIAKVLDRSWVWVKTALHRARRKLSPHLRPLVDGEYRKSGEAWQTT